MVYKELGKVECTRNICEKYDPAKTKATKQRLKLGESRIEKLLLLIDELID